MTVAAIYRNGVFVPTESVALPENAQVRVVTVQAPGTGKSAWERHALHLGGDPPADFKSSVPEMESPVE